MILLDILFKPRVAFDRIQKRNLLRKAFIFYLFSCLAGTFLIYAMPADWAQNWMPAVALLGAAGLHPMQFLYAISESRLFDFDKLMNHTFQWADYPRFAVAGLAFVTGLTFAFMFPAATDITVKRMWKKEGNYKNLLASSFFINATGMVLIVCAVILACFVRRAEVGTITMGQLMNNWTLIIPWGLFLVWLVILGIFAIGKIYSLSFTRASFVGLTVLIVFPVCLFLSFCSELTHAFRVKARKHRLDNLRRSIKQYQQENKHQDIRRQLEEYLTVYGEETVIGDKLRKRIELAEFLFEVSETDRDAVLKQIISLSEHNRSEVRLEAAQALMMILEADVNAAIQNIHFLIKQRCPPQVLSAVNDISEDPVVKGLCRAYYCLLTDGRNTLKKAVALFESTKGIQYGRELYLAYGALLTLSEAKTLNDIFAIEPNITEVLRYDDVILVEIIDIFKHLLEVLGYLSVYERVDSGNRLPYLAAPLMVLIGIENTIRQSKNGTDPGAEIIEALIPNLQGILTREFERLKGRADLELDLEPKRAIFEDRITLLVTVRNRGNAVAENVDIRLTCPSGSHFSISDLAPDSGKVSIALLSPQREEKVEFRIKPSQLGRLRIPFEIEYSDMEKKGKVLQFADSVEISQTPESVLQPGRKFTNPYIAGPPVQGNMFWGREEVFQFIRQRLAEQSQKTIIVLRGERRTGKTSVLYQLKYRLDEKYIPVFIDIQGLTVQGLDSFLYTITRLIVRELKEHGISIEQPSQAQFGADPGGFFEYEFLNKVLDQIEYRHLLLLFDEFEHLVEQVRTGKSDTSIFPFLRHLMQHTTRLDFIFAGTQQLRKMTQDSGLILFNTAVYQDIAFMKREEAEELIRKPVENVMFYDLLAVEKIIGVTAGHPYFVQLICMHLTDVYIKTQKYTITLQDVNGVLDSVLDGGRMQFDFIWDETSLEARFILAVLADTITREGTTAGLNDVEKTLKKYGVTMDANQIISVVQSLAVRDILDADNKTYRCYQFKVDLIRLWVKRTQSLSIIADTFRERNNSLES